MAANGLASNHFACKCLNIRIQPGFKAVYVGEEGISVAHTEVILRSRSKAVPVSGSPTAELTRYTTITCLACEHLTYRVKQRITPDLSAEEGPVFPTDDWFEKELCKSTTGWIEVYQDCLADDEITQAESSPMYSKLFHIVLPGGTPPTAPSQLSEEDAEAQNLRGHSEHGKTHLPELPPLFLPPPFTPSHVVFSHFSAIASEQSQKLRDQAEEYLAQVTAKKVAEVRQAEALLKQEVELVWGQFTHGLQLLQQTGPMSKVALPLRPRGSVSGHTRSLSTPAQGISGSVRITNFVPAPSQSTRTSPNQPALPSALAASLKTTGMHYPGAQQRVNGNGNTPLPRGSSSSPPSDGGRTSRSSATRVHSPSTASTRTAAISIDAEMSIREAYRREMNEAKDIATSFRYVSDLEAQMEQQHLEAEEEETLPPVASSSHATVQASTSTAAQRSPRVHRSAIKHTGATDTPTSPKAKDKEGADDKKEGGGKGKRKVTFDVKPEVAIIKDEGEATFEQPTSSEAAEDPIFDMDNESEHSASTRSELPVEHSKIASSVPAEPVRAPPRPSHSRSSSKSSLPPQLSSLRPASLPAPSAMRAPQRHPTPPANETAERTRALREALVSKDAQRTRDEVVESPIENAPERGDTPQESLDPREAEILRLVAASTPSHRSAWKKNSKAWQVFLSRRERRAGDIAPPPISEEGSYVLDDFDPQAGRYFNGVADSDVTDDDDTEDDKWANGSDPDHSIAQSLPIPIGPLSQHRQTFGVPPYQPKTSLSDRPGTLVPPLKNATSSSLRRASYAERDRMRPVDPGNFAFIADDDEEEEEDVESDPETGGKARQRALKILKARNELPAAGMWRSLA
ncbi:hypothetical protein C8Q80DRAFT_1157901 [Daedaleopsis nitida]|nr:hypothetical protein C8Q80DRAFT_1157901 [Daedaleopsis nitida]